MAIFRNWTMLPALSQLLSQASHDMQGRWGESIFVPKIVLACRRHILVQGRLSVSNNQTHRQNLGSTYRLSASGGGEIGNSSHELVVL